jgi:serine-type D-Ala-D-Ala carboxypeptidase
MLLDQVTNSLLPHDFAVQDEKFQHAFGVLDVGIQHKSFPGASIAIAHQGRLIARKAFGRFTYDANSARVIPAAIYDLASVTKVVATTTACMILYEQGKFRLEQPVVEVLPEFAGYDARRALVTFRMLLAHSSGLPAYARMFEAASSKNDVMEQAFQMPLEADPGSRSLYSDVGFILVGEAVERLSGEPLDKLCKAQVFKPLGLATMTFKPAADLKPLIPPTEDDQTFRHEVVQGQVNDENAWAMGGVAGHAGCFATAQDVATFAEFMLRGGRPLLQAHTVELFTRREQNPAGTSRTLGWDTPSAPSQSGNLFSARSYGHLGYTGTSLWIDPERQLSVTLLTNRTWPDRGAQTIKQIRPAFHDAVIEALK